MSQDQAEKPKTTPGPWEWLVYPDLKASTLVGKSGLTVLCTKRSGALAQLLVRTKSGMVPLSNLNENYQAFDEANHPDANLIASAPELLEVVRDWLRFDSTITDPDSYFKLLDRAQKLVERFE